MLQQGLRGGGAGFAPRLARAASAAKQPDPNPLPATAARRPWLLPGQAMNGGRKEQPRVPLGAAPSGLVGPLVLQKRFLGPRLTLSSSRRLQTGVLRAPLADLHRRLFASSSIPTLRCNRAWHGPTRQTTPPRPIGARDFSSCPILSLQSRQHRRVRL